MAEKPKKASKSTKAHPSSYARLFSELGIEAAFIDEPAADLDIEGANFLWRSQSKHFQNQKQVFTTIISPLDNSYCWPKGFAVDANYEYAPEDIFDGNTEKQGRGDYQSSDSDAKMIKLINHIN